MKSINLNSMDTLGNIIVFRFNPKNSVKRLFWWGTGLLLFEFVALLLIVGLMSKGNWKEIMEDTLFMMLFGLPIPIILWIWALVRKMKAKKGLYISISPEGVRKTNGKTIPMADIADCHFVYSFKAGSLPTPDTPAASLVVRLRDKKKPQQIYLDCFEAPILGEVEQFYSTAKQILGVDIFTKHELLKIHTD